MIASFRAQNGETGFSFNERLLCSKVAPSKEASAFVARHMSSIQKSQTIFLLGLGSGHIVEELHRLYPQKKIVVIESESQIIETVSFCFAFALMNLEVVNANDVANIKGHKSVVMALKLSYCILTHPCTQWLNRDFYQKVEELLLGRTPAAFTFLVGVRDDVRDILRPLLDVNGLASIKTITQNMSGENKRSKTKLIIKSLRELVI